jgi:hypothetical protein
MKDHFISLFDASNRGTTLRYFAIAVVLIVASQITGLNHNLIGKTSLLTGICFVFYALVHTWKKGRNYAVMAWFCAGIIALTSATILVSSWLGFEKFISQPMIMFIVFLICLPGIIVGILGSVFYD